LTVAKAAKRRRAAKESGASKSKPGTIGTRKHKRKPERPSPRDEAAFSETLIATGEAARPDATGRLPRGATHEIVEDEAGNVKVVRRRFSVT
jgi:hypothetical protein